MVQYAEDDFNRGEMMEDRVVWVVDDNSSMDQMSVVELEKSTAVPAGGQKWGATNVMYRYVTTINAVTEFVPDLQCVNVQMVLLKNLVMMKIQLMKYQDVQKPVYMVDDV